MESTHPQEVSRDHPKSLFYNKGEPHYWFTDFSSHSVVYEEKRYPTSEHLSRSFKINCLVISARVLNRAFLHRFSTFTDPPRWNAYGVRSSPKGGIH